MKNLIFIICLFSCCLLRAQDPPGIKFIKASSWTEVKEKAKRENKFIFLDCYTTWCTPCKKMDSEVFSLSKVGSFFNSNFLPVKVQFDVTKNDSEEIKKWYNDVPGLKKAYPITSYPTYLFFNPAGELVHKIRLSFNWDEFIALAQDALVKENQYYTLKRQYESGKRDPKSLLLLQNAAGKADDQKFRVLVINEYLATQSDLLTEENIRLSGISTLKSTDPGFKVFKKFSAKADSVLGKGRSAELVKEIAMNETVIPFLRNGGSREGGSGGMIILSGNIVENPDWKSLELALYTKYPEHASQVLLEARPMYYDWVADWPKFNESVSHYLSKSGNNLNHELLISYASSVSSSCDDKKYIDSAIKWCDKISFKNSTNLSFLNTYSRLLYKASKKNEAIRKLEDAIKVSSEADIIYWKAQIQKMKNGEKI